MTPQNADTVILTSAIVTAGSTFGRQMLPKDMGGKGALPSARTVIGTAVAFTALSLVAPFAPNFAAMWALLLMTIAFLDTGAPLLEKYLNAR